MSLTILLAEDEEQLSRVYTAALKHQGYQVDQVYNGQDAIEKAHENAYDVFILDIMMPIKTGLEALREIRASGDHTHAIMLTAMSEIEDKVTGLEAGADDYLTKPISLKELLARLASLERRLDRFTDKVLTFGSVKLDLAQQEMVSGNSIRLAGKESKLMAFFLCLILINLYQPKKFFSMFGQKMMILKLMKVMSSSIFLILDKN